MRWRIRAFSLPWRLVIYVLGVAGSPTHILYGPYLTLNHHGIGESGDVVSVHPDDFLGLGGLRVLQVSPLNRSPQAAQTGLRKLSALTFGVYLIHLLIIPGPRSLRLAAGGLPAGGSLRSDGVGFLADSGVAAAVDSAGPQVAGALAGYPLRMKRRART